MTTLIYIENVLGSGQMVTLSEDFGDHTVTRDLRPGEHARLVVSSFKSLSIEEAALTADIGPDWTPSLAFDTANGRERLCA